MPRFKKGSKEAKKYMSQVRAKRLAKQKKQKLETVKDFQVFYVKEKNDYIDSVRNQTPLDSEPIITAETETQIKQKALINAINYLLTK